MVGRRLTCADMIAECGRPSGAQPTMEALRAAETG